MAFLFAFSHYSYAQNFGIRAGLNISNVDIPDIKTDSKIGLQIGPVMDLALTNDISIIAGILYSQKGYKFVDNGTMMDNKFSYLDIPLLVQVKFGRFYVEGGPGYSVLLTAIRNGSIDIKNFFKDSDMGINAGIGVDLSAIRLDVRYGAGFSNIADNPDPEEEAFKNNVITVGISFFL
jgi:hypothetical protein